MKLYSICASKDIGYWLHDRYVVVIAWYRMQYGKYFLSLSYFPTRLKAQTRKIFANIARGNVR